MPEVPGHKKATGAGHKECLRSQDTKKQQVQDTKRASGTVQETKSATGT